MNIIMRKINVRNAIRATEIQPQDPFYLKIAYRLAINNVLKKGGEAFGAILVRKGKILGRGQNQSIQTFDATSHGEIEAIRDASRRTGLFNYSGGNSTMYTNSEPCSMCFSAIAWAGIDRIVFGTSIQEDSQFNYAGSPIYGQVCLPKAERIITHKRFKLNNNLTPFIIYRKLQQKRGKVGPGFTKGNLVTPHMPTYSKKSFRI